jgi:hypothetical protein
LIAVNKSQRAALFVFLSLLGAVGAGLALYGVYSGRTQTAVPLLIGCVLAAFVLVLAAARIAIRHRRSRRLAEEHHVPPSGLLHLLDLRQWLTLTVGITVIAITTGALTGVRVLASDTGTQALDPAPVVAPTTTPPVLVVEPPTPEDSPSADESSEPAESADPAETTAEDGSTFDAPAPGATKYLDSEDVIDGSYTPKAVNLSAVRYPRGISFDCDTATDTHLQWNVAGNARFTATAGIDDNTQNTYGVVA